MRHTNLVAMWIDIEYLFTVHLEPIESRPHFATSTTVTPQNDVRGTTTEIP